MNQKKMFEDFAQKFQTMSVKERWEFMQKLPRGAVLDLYAEKCSLEQLRQLKADFLARGSEEDWYTLLKKLGKRHSPHFSLLRT